MVAQHEHSVADGVLRRRRLVWIDVRAERACESTGFAAVAEQNLRAAIPDKRLETLCALFPLRATDALGRRCGNPRRVRHKAVDRA